MVGHLGMTGRMYLLPAKAPLPRHAAVVLNLGRENFVFEDTRYFGRLTLDARALARLGPEPLGPAPPPPKPALVVPGPGCGSPLLYAVWTVETA